jgi:hypothetical protein
MREYQSTAYDPGQDKGPEFALDGEVFRCLPSRPVAATITMTLGGRLTITECFAYVEACLVPEDEERFRSAVMAKGERFVGVEVMEEIFNGIVEDYAEGFPTRPFAPSSNGHAPTGPSLTDGRSSPASTSSG